MEETLVSVPLSCVTSWWMTVVGELVRERDHILKQEVRETERGQACSLYDNPLEKELTQGSTF
jgi:hypothetical protein